MWMILIFYIIFDPLIIMRTVQSNCLPGLRTEKRPEEDNHPYRFLPATTIWPETATPPDRRTYVDPDRLRSRNDNEKSENDHHSRRVKKMALIDDCTKQKWSDEEARRRQKEEELIEWMRRRTIIYNYRHAMAMAADDISSSPLHEGGPPPEEGWRPPWIDPSLLFPTTWSTLPPHNQNDDDDPPPPTTIETETEASPLSTWPPFTTPSSNLENSTQRPITFTPTSKPTVGSLGSQTIQANVTGSSGLTGNGSGILSTPTSTKIPFTTLPTSKIPDKITTKIPLMMTTTKIPTVTSILTTTKIPTIASTTATSITGTTRPPPSTTSIGGNGSVTTTTTKKPIFTNTNLAPAWPSSPGPSYPASPNITMVNVKPQLNSTVSSPPIPTPTNNSSSAAADDGGVTISSEQTTVSNDFVENIGHDHHDGSGQIAGDGVCSCIIRHHNWEQRKVLEAKLRDEIKSTDYSLQ